MVMVFGNCPGLINLIRSLNITTRIMAPEIEWFRWIQAFVKS